MQQEVRDARHAVESKEALLLKLHSTMGIAPRFRFEKTESGGSARVVDVGGVVEKFVAFEKATLESERLLQQRREAITVLQEETDDVKWGIEEEEARMELAGVAARAAALQQSQALALAAAAVEAEVDRCSAAEKLLFCMESRLAGLNDKFEREVIEEPLPDVPVRRVLREPPPRSATEAATRALEQRLAKLIGCRCVCVHVCPMCVCVCVCVSAPSRVYPTPLPAASPYWRVTFPLRGV